MFHRENGPAVIDENGDEFWYKNGVIYEQKITRTEKNGVITYTNEKGEKHRDDGPAVIWNNGTEFWYKNGKKHRENGLPAISCKDGSRYWMVNGAYHRENGPAVIEQGKEHWYKNGKRIQ